MICALKVKPVQADGRLIAGTEMWGSDTHLHCELLKCLVSTTKLQQIRKEA